MIAFNTIQAVLLLLRCGRFWNYTSPVKPGMTINPGMKSKPGMTSNPGVTKQAGDDKINTQHFFPTFGLTDFRTLSISTSSNYQITKSCCILALLSFIRNISSSDRTDKELVDQYKSSGNLEVLGSLYQRYMDLVYGVCLKYFKDSEASKDAVMQIFEELVSKLKKHEVENFRGWLHQVARNYCLMQLRTPRNLKTVEFKTELMQSEENVHLNGVLEKEENFNKLEYCIGTLTTEQQQAIKLFYLEGKCYNEIVEITGQEWNQVRSFIQNGRRNLKICMEKEETGHEKLRTN